MDTNNDKVRNPKQERGIKTKIQIVEAAMKLFSEKGFHGTNSKEIAKEAGVSTGCFYSYFVDKNAVFMDALIIYTSKFDKIIEEHLNLLVSEINNDERLILKRLIESILDAHDIFTEFHNELIVMYYSNKEVYALLEEHHKKNLQFTIKYLNEWKHRIKVNDIEAAASITYWTVHGVVDAIVELKGSANKQKLIDELSTMLYKYLF